MSARRLTRARFWCRRHALPRIVIAIIAATLLTKRVHAAPVIVIDNQYLVQQLDALDKQLPAIAKKSGGKAALANAHAIIAQLKQQLQSTSSAQLPDPFSTQTASTATPMPPVQFDILLRKLASTGIPHERVEVIESSAHRHHFLCDQAAALIAIFPLPEDRVQVVTLLAPNIVDPQNHPSLLPLFPIPSDQDRVKALFDAAPAEPYEKLR
jgi:hypothetical protein